MFIDLVGYTSISQRDERLALQLLEEYRNVVRPFFPRHSGHEIKTMGDAFLVEFSSDLEAVRCAFAIQQSLHELNSGRSVEKKLQARVGIHTGDVIRSQNDIYGDAVNIASRIEPLAEPGGICISRQVFDQVRNKFEFPFMSIGNRTLKNVDLPVEIYRIVMPWQHEQVSSIPSARRIAVLPFTNMSPDPQDEYFSDGMTEEVISAISRIKGIEVISRTSIMQYKKSPKPVREISKELDVGTILEGSVRKYGNQVRVTVQMVDAQRDRHLWADSYDRDFRDVFAIQSDIAQRVAQAMEGKFADQDRMQIERGSTMNSEAHIDYLRGRYHMTSAHKEGISNAVAYLERAIAADPTFALAFAALADCYTYMAGEYMPEVDAFQKAKQFAQQAVRLNDSLAEGHTSLGIIAMQYEWDWTKSDQELTRAIELSPSYWAARLWYGMYLALTRRGQEGVLELMKAEELDPLSPLAKLNVGVVLYYAGRYDEAIAKLKEARELEPRNEMAYLILAWAYLAKSLYDDAIAEAKRSATLGEFPGVVGTLGYAYAVSGRINEALDSLARLKNQEGKGLGILTNAAMIHVGLGEQDRALDYLEKALEERESWLMFTSQTPIYDPIRMNPRFLNIIRKIGLP
jgi:TolB-like protein/tetratricopeptide (TPR) repeat protein